MEKNTIHFKLPNALDSILKKQKVNPIPYENYILQAYHLYLQNILSLGYFLYGLSMYLL